MVGSGFGAKLSDFVGTDVSELLLWREPLKSGAALVGATALYVLLEWTTWSLVSILSTVAFFAIILSFIWASIAGFLNKAGPPVPSILREGVSEGQVKHLVEEFTPLLNKGLALAYRLATGKDFALSAQAAFVLFVVSKLSSRISVLSTAYLVVLLAFSAPKLYELKKTDIDTTAKETYSKAAALYEQHVAPLVAKIPRASSATSVKPDAQPDKSPAQSVQDYDRPAISPRTLSADGNKKAL